MFSLFIRFDAAEVNASGKKHVTACFSSGYVSSAGIGLLAEALNESSLSKNLFKKKKNIDTLAGIGYIYRCSFCRLR